MIAEVWQVLTHSVRYPEKTLKVLFWMVSEVAPWVWESVSDVIFQSLSTYIIPTLYITQRPFW